MGTTEEASEIDAAAAGEEEMEVSSSMLEFGQEGNYENPVHSSQFAGGMSRPMNLKSAYPLAKEQAETTLSWRKMCLVFTVVKVFTSNVKPNYAMPWQMKPEVSATASGFIITGRKIL